MKCEQICQRFDALESQRRILDDTLQAIEKYVLPYRGAFFKPLTSESEVEWRRRLMYDSTAPIACDLLASQIHSNLTSPSIRWFELKFRNPALNSRQPAIEWLQEVERRIWQALIESDFNMEVAEAYLDLCGFGTAIVFEEAVQDEDDNFAGITFTTIPLRDGYFELGADDKLLRVYRRLQYTPLQLKDRFKHELDTDEKHVDQKLDVIFCVYRRPEIKFPVDGRKAPDARPFGYKYVLKKDKTELEKGGYYEMPAFVARWKKVSGSVWGHSQAMVCLSDVLQLNAVVAMTSEARAKEIDPPMKSTERGLLTDLDLNPGGLTLVAEMDELDRLLQANPGLFQGDQEIARLQESVNRCFFVDKLELKDSPAMTATEVMVRYERMQRQFASTIGRLQADFLDPMIETTYAILARNGGLPKPPEGLELEELDIEYTGPIPRAQRNEQAQNISLWASEMVGLSQAMPDILDVPDSDAVARQLANDRGVPANLLRDKRAVEQIRQQRAEQQQTMAGLEMMRQAGEAERAMGEGQDALDGAE